MMTLRRADDRGHADHGWLQSHHSFSFAEYQDPAHVSFGPLRVINDDIIAPGGGFGMHGHRDMEIVTYVLDGAIAHKDSLGNGATVRPGEVAGLWLSRALGPLIPRRYRPVAAARIASTLLEAALQGAPGELPTEFVGGGDLS